MSTVGYPGAAASYANQFSNNNLVATSTVESQSTSILTSTGCRDFGFPAGLIKLAIDSAGGVAYLQFNGQVATTRDYKLTTVDTLTDWYDLGVAQSGFSIAATSTGLIMRMGAWG